MFLSKKDNLAKFINENDVTIHDLAKLTRDKNFPDFEVRTVGSAGIVQIKFPHQEWIKPDEWAFNHFTTMESILCNDLERLEAMSTDMRCLAERGYLSYDHLISDETSFSAYLNSKCGYDPSEEDAELDECFRKFVRERYNEWIFSTLPDD